MGQIPFSARWGKMHTSSVLMGPPPWFQLSHVQPATFNAGRLWTSFKHLIMEECHASRLMAILTTTISTFANQGGSDGLVDIMTGATALVLSKSTTMGWNTLVHINPNRAQMWNNRSKLEGIKGIQGRANELGTARLEHTYDNQSAVSNTNTPFYNRAQMLNAEADIILAIYHPTKNGTNFLLWWVKAHQDKNLPEV